MKYFLGDTVTAFSLETVNNTALMFTSLKLLESTARKVEWLFVTATTYTYHLTETTGVCDVKWSRSQVLYFTSVYSDLVHYFKS